VLIVTLFVSTGVYNIGADAPHWRPEFLVMELFRERSIAAQPSGEAVPYAAMCGGCHLVPGQGNSEIREGLYPQPPKLILRSPADPAAEFWMIKHGIKMTAMPALGLATTMKQFGDWSHSFKSSPR